MEARAIILMACMGMMWCPAIAQSSKDALGGASDAAQRVFGQRMEATVDTTLHAPVFPGGMEAMHAWLRKHVRYPKRAWKQKVEGTVYVRFVVCSDGKVRYAEVMRGVRKDLDKEALRAVARMPDWLPGRKEGRAVNCRYTLPVAFKLDRPGPAGSE
ncbi:MAG: energy transducer TonB [Bacteroidetes bacterium]|nr:energy transducer TonB [Bacteroidota bacterium]